MHSKGNEFIEFWGLNLSIMGEKALTMLEK